MTEEKVWCKGSAINPYLVNALIDRKALDSSQLLDLGAHVADGLAAAHGDDPFLQPRALPA